MEQAKQLSSPFIYRTSHFSVYIQFSDRLNARDVIRHQTEARVRCVALNHKVRFGLPDSYRIN